MCSADNAANADAADAQSFIGEMDLWCTNQQFWEIGAGDEEEHATMLFNYLYYLVRVSKRSPSSVVMGGTVSLL